MPGIIPPEQIIAMLKANQGKKAPKKPTSTPRQVKTAHDMLTGKNSPYSGLTKGDVQTNDSGFSTTRKQRVTQIQQILVNHGYKIKVDGIAGPETNSALADFHGSHPNPKAWDGGHTPGGVANPVDPHQVGTFNIRDGKGNEQTITPTPPSGGGDTGSGISMKEFQKLMGNVGLNPNNFKVNAAKFAQAQADEQYNPQIADANQKIGDATARAKVNLDDLTKWFGDASGIAATGATQARKDDRAAINDHAQASRAILGAFGGDAGAGGQSIDNTAQNGNNLLSATMANHTAFNDMLKGLISTQGATAKADQSNRDQTSIGDMKNMLTSLIAAKASALTADTTSAKQQNLQNLLNITSSNNQSRAAKLNEIITMATLPSQLAAANLKTANTESLINSRGTKGAPRNFFVNASANDIIGAKGAVASWVKSNGGSGKVPLRQAIAQAKALIPWKWNTPGVASRVLIPALTMSGYSGVTPQMLGING